MRCISMRWSSRIESRLNALPPGGLQRVSVQKALAGRIALAVEQAGYLIG
ncbi:hypothetical protein HCL65_004694 [Salmonella enterica subsp. enterica]|nr:hypothetical protein [Salmonella enterica subsp. enterica serovar Grumpensis]